MDKRKLLKQVTAFGLLSDDQLGLLARSVGVQAFQRAEPIFHQGSIGSTLFIIVAGQVRIYTTSEAGQELTITLLREGDFFGEMALLDGQPRAASAEAMCKTLTLTLHRSAFLHTISACPPIAASVLEVMALRLRQSNTVAEQLANLSAAQRVVLQLRGLVARYGIADDGALRIDLHLTQDDLASLSGTTRETVNRVLAHLREQGVIRVERARISILDLAQLEQS
ncbi:MAG: Crp/Fnr family transcriptional regulator [Kouleothrix sp.]|jgi:CRP-like cAMP-binding protein|nr:Crp/Fnr family transcriptional regulator [Kouleothrix sp.]